MPSLAYTIIAFGFNDDQWFQTYYNMVSFPYHVYEVHNDLQYYYLIIAFDIVLKHNG